MERNISMSRCCCCGELLPSEFVISIGNFQRVCVECADEISLAVKHRKDLFEDHKLPVLALVRVDDKCHRHVTNGEGAKALFENVVAGATCEIVELTKEQFGLIAAEADSMFEANPMLRRAYFDHYKIAEWMALNSTGNETEADMKSLMIAGWKAVSKDRMDDAEEICYHPDYNWSDTDCRYDLSEQVWVPFPSEDAILFLFEKMLSRDDVQFSRARNAEWQAEHHNQTEDEE